VPTSSVYPNAPHAPGSSRRAVAAATAIVVLGAGLLVGGFAAPAAAAPADCRALPVDADAELRSDLARAEFDVDGTGVKVGIISNSYSLAGQEAIDTNIAQGLLPGPGNPCGWLTPVTEVYPSVAAPGNDDEGRAMAQLVHGVAPGAELYFAPAVGDNTLDSDQAAMAQSIQALVDRGVDVIVDDITLPDEPFFQESALSARIGQLEAQGVVYLSAAGNETVVASAPLDGQRATPVNGWSTTAFRPTACDDYVARTVRGDGRYTDATFDCMDFAAGADPDATALFGVLPDEVQHDDTAFVTAALMQWGEPQGALAGTFEMVLSALKTSGTAPDGSACTPQVPCTEGALVPTLDTVTPARYASEFLLSSFGDVTEIEVALVRITQKSPADPVADVHPAIGYLFPNNGAQWIAYAEYPESNGTDLVGRSVIGHNAAAGAITVAATGYQADDAIEKYSSLGPVRYTLSSQAATPEVALAEPSVHRIPEIVSVDGVRQTVLLDYPAAEPGVGYFYGTSAATPNAGAVVALALQLNPDLTTTAVREYLRATAMPLASPYAGVSVEDSVGAGLVNAQALLQRVAADLPAPAPNTPPVRVLPATGAGDAGGMLAVGLIATTIGIAVIVRRRLLARD
jgi:hypothetical protein